MSSQIFKQEIPNQMLYDLLEKICIKHNNYYILNKIAYKKGDFLALIEPFCESILDYYFDSKKFYVSRKQKYSTFITIIRQICRANNITYSSKIVYNKSVYDIVYNIYFSEKV